MKTKWAKPTKFSAFLKKNRASQETSLTPDVVSDADPVAILVHSWLLWEASSEQASTAMAKLLENRVDFNELRVSLPHEIAAIVGKRYPRVEERLHGIRRTLHDLFLRRHELSFDYLAEKGKRDIKAEIESLDGITPFVAARLLRIAFDVHSMPADDQLSALFFEHDVIDEPVDPEELAGWLTSNVKSDDAVAVIASLQSAVDSAWSAGTMSKLVRRHRPLKVVEVVEVVEVAEVEEVEEVEVVEKAPAKKTAPKKTSAKKKPAAKKTPAKKTPSKKTPAKKAAAKKTPAKKTPAKKTPAKKPASKKSGTTKKTKKVAGRSGKKATSRAKKSR